MSQLSSKRSSSFTPLKFTREIGELYKKYPEHLSFPSKTEVISLRPGFQISEARKVLEQNFVTTPIDVITKGRKTSPFTNYGEKPGSIIISGSSVKLVDTRYLRRCGINDSIDVFLSSTVTPYTLSPNDVQILSTNRLSSNRYGTLFNQLYAVLTNSYSMQKSYKSFRKQSVGATRIPTLFRISSRALCDDLGRIYVRRDDSSKFMFYQYRLSIGSDLRNDITLYGYGHSIDTPVKLSRSVYQFIGVAGYMPYYQSDFMFSLRYDVHHVEENRFDIRPSSLQVVHSHSHRYLHSRDLSYSKRCFFKSLGSWFSDDSGLVKVK